MRPNIEPRESIQGLSSELLVHLQGTRRILSSQLGMIGEMPPCPPTMRGRVGRVLVWMVRRAMFWYIDQEREFHRQQLQMFDSMLAIFREILVVNEQNRIALQNTRNYNGATGPLAMDEIDKYLASHDVEMKRMLDAALRAETKARLALEVFVENHIAARESR